jgi:hypothetical protein
MGGGVSPMGIVRVSVVLLHVSLIGESGNEKPEANRDKNSLPDSLGNLIPHLLVQQMDLLQSSKIIFLAGCIGQAPNSQVVHVSQLSPGMGESGTTSGEELVLELWLLEVSGGSKELSEVLGFALHE